ncbi:MAG: hypothetical protein JWQ53_2286 [Klenkia sp.]|nr:hypothetical protein [Klenkia sp.]
MSQPPYPPDDGQQPWGQSGQGDPYGQQPGQGQQQPQWGQPQPQYGQQGQYELAQGCFDGDFEACLDLWLQADIGSAYETYGDTCGGRVSEQEASAVFCSSIE